jgi:hypothetical protein
MARLEAIRFRIELIYRYQSELKRNFDNVPLKAKILNYNRNRAVLTILKEEI